MRILWDERAWEEYIEWQQQDKKTLKRINILIKDIDIDNLKVGVKTRYSKKESMATLHTLENNKIKITFNEPEKSLTPGQSAVFYIDSIVVGGGIIEQAL